MDVRWRQLVACAWLLCACAESQDDAGAGEHGANDPCESTYASLRDDVFVPRCSAEGCHGADAPAAGLDLTRPEPDALVQVPSAACEGDLRVVPGDPASSVLYTKLTSEPTCGRRMPINGDPLSAPQLECVAGWIDGVEGSCETCGTTACVDTSSDAMNCGACGLACPAGVACDQGACACGAGREVCDDACVQVNSNPAHCGSCGNACADVEVCFMGDCASDCGALTVCGQSCVDTMTDPDHCGGCGLACADGQACVDGSCACDGPAVDFGTDIEPLLADACATMGCHANPKPKQDLDLNPGVAYDALVGAPSMQCQSRLLVDPGSPATSYLLDKLRGVDLCSGSRMPKGASPLPSSDVAAISSWICNGANP